MSTKPATIPVFDSGAVNVATPSAGRIASGFPNGAIPTAGEMNYLFMWLYLWTQYLSDGNFSGAATFASTLGVTGLLTATAGVTVPTGQNVTLVGTADLKHGNKTLELGAFGQVSQITYDVSGVSLTASNSGGVAGFIAIPIPLKVGDRIQSITFNRKGNAGAYTQVCSIQKQSNAGTLTVVQTAGSVSTPTGAVWTQQVVTVSSPVAIVAGESWYAVWQPNAVIQSLSGVDVIYDRP